MSQNSQMTKSTEAKLHLLNDNAKLLFTTLLYECYKQDLNVQISYSYRTFTMQYQSV
jgi:hypothetical protein